MSKFSYIQLQETFYQTFSHQHTTFLNTSIPEDNSVCNKFHTVCNKYNKVSFLHYIFSQTKGTERLILKYPLTEISFSFFLSLFFPYLRLYVIVTLIEFSVGMSIERNTLPSVEFSTCTLMYAGIAFDG